MNCAIAATLNRKRVWVIATLLGLLAIAISYYMFLILPEQHVVIREGDKFELHFFRWRFPRGEDLLTVTSDGSAVYHSPAPGQKCCRKRFIVDDKRLADLVQKINTMNLMAMNDVYRHPGAEDGMVWYLLLKTEERMKSVHCSNRFPPAITGLIAYLDEEILKRFAEPLPPEFIQQNDFRKFELGIRQNVRFQ
jgi:hypothetical protein